MGYPSLKIEDWRPTRDTLHGYTRLLGKVRAALAPPSKHWGHVSLRVAARGLTTSPMPAGERTLEVLMDLTGHELAISTNYGERASIPLRGQSLADLCQATLGALAGFGAEPAVDRSLFDDASTGPYDRDAVERFWAALSRIHMVFERFKGALREETAPVQVFPHHFDLSMSWFSGRLVPGADPADEESADEQMNFGFVTGDETVSEAYFYATAYPQPDGFVGGPLPVGAHWQTQGFSGAVLPYPGLLEAEDPDGLLLEFLHGTHRAGSTHMKSTGTTRRRPVRIPPGLEGGNA